MFLGRYIHDDNNEPVTPNSMNGFQCLDVYSLGPKFTSSERTFTPNIREHVVTEDTPKTRPQVTTQTDTELVHSLGDRGLQVLLSVSRARRTGHESVVWKG